MTKQYTLFYFPTVEQQVQPLINSPKIKSVGQIDWNYFPDGTPNFRIHGFDENLIEGADILFYADFRNFSNILAQFSVLFVFCESFINSLTVVCPFYPTATMERVIEEGEIATANTLAWMFNSLPRTGNPAKVIIYDLHTLQNRFYFKGGALPSMATAIPLVKQAMEEEYGETPFVVGFPDEGAQKRFGAMFKGCDLVTCGKKRIGDVRKVVIQDGDVEGKRVVIIDDLVQSGGTLNECKKVLIEAGAIGVDCYCTHAVFPNQGWRQFLEGGSKEGFGKFWVTDSVPEIANEINGQGPFVVLPLGSHLETLL
eukprot:TRINITY_DN2034_c0_g1_i1.p1 TRINITY_DN2034_c0_g1~~TRINITY_DN2034_c0_g1_i1.p1  ORF type:complete len:312 (-),score=66.29 TRINITY_DN2034_c0_g1_i1:31-966(-)